LQADEPGYLCETCRHIDFKYLINSSIEQMLEEIQLNSLAHILENEKCAFCRLVTFTIRDMVEGREIDTTVAEKPVMCIMRTMSIETETRDSRQMMMFTLFSPDEIDGLSSIYSLISKNETLVSEMNDHKSVTFSQIKYDLIKK